MKAVILFAHPNPLSFNQAILEATVSILEKKQIDYTVRNLYELSFNPVLKPSDFELLMQSKVATDIIVEQEAIRQADLIIPIFPIWWAGMPAILKGYIDRVFSNGFAYRYTEAGPEGLFENKRAVIINTSGAPNEVYQEMGMHESLAKTIDLGIFQFCGIEVIAHRYFGGVPSVTDEERKQMLEELPSLFEHI